jgi:hypothetical protein
MDEPLLADFTTALDEMTLQKPTGSTPRDAPQHLPQQSTSGGFLWSACSVCAMRKEGANKVLPIASERASFPAVSEREDETTPLASPGLPVHVKSMINGETTHPTNQPPPTTDQPEKSDAQEAPADIIARLADGTRSLSSLRFTAF